MKFACNYCKATLPHFKALIDHCQEKHPDKIRWYLIKHKVIGNKIYAPAESPEQLCKVNGWDIKDCRVQEIGG